MTAKRFLWTAVVLSTVGQTRLPGQAVGEIRGTVTDPSGAVIPGAKVTAKQTSTQLMRFTISSNAGSYSLPSLPVGTYSLQADASGFKSSTSEVKLDVDQQLEVN